ncbi:MAG TPA: hypothetical protein VM124_02530 [Candidatus Limnocylindrales bacterium]|nr:hypothetical protein [Candidatus Limnocylindrales bacterium]
MNIRKRKPVHNVIGPPGDLAFSDLADMPRLLVPDEDIMVFEGIKKAGQQGPPGFYREDELVLSHFGLNAHISWQNRYRRGVKAEEMTDPWIMSPKVKHGRSNLLFTATLDVLPETFAKAWEQDQAVFVHSPTSIELRQTPQTEHRGLLVRRLFSGLKLAVNTQAGTYVAAPERRPVMDVPLTFCQFRPFGWELLGDTASDARYLYAPDEANLGILSAHFMVDEQGSGGLTTGRPLAGIK